MIQIPPLSRNDMRMHMRHALPGIHPILNRDIQTTRTIHALDHPAYAADCEEEIGCFRGGQVGDAGDYAARGD